MATYRTAVRLALLPGVLVLCALVAAGLAVTDILQGERDADLEKTVLQIAFVLIFIFEVIAIFTLRRGLREPERGQGTEND